MKMRSPKKLKKKRKQEIPTTKFTRFVSNLKGVFLKRKKMIIKKKEENDLNESEFFKIIKDMVILNLRKEDIIKYFKKDCQLRTKIETRSVADYLTVDKKNLFLNMIRNISKGKLYTLVQNLSIEFYKKGDLIFYCKEPMNKFYIILEGTISLYLPYLSKKVMSVKDFLTYFFYIKANFPKSFRRIEKKNEFLYDGIYKLKVNEYDINCIPEGEQEKMKDFYVEEYQNVFNIKKGNQINQISMLYNLNQNFNGYALTDVYLLYLHRYEFMNILRIILEDELSKEFFKLRKYCYIFNLWSNYSLAQIINYYIPFTLINEETLYRQKDESDSFYIIQDGIFEAYCEISLAEFSQFKKYILKDNQNVIDWIKEEQDNKNKISVEKIIDYISWKLKNEKYPSEKEASNKNLLNIKKNLLKSGDENKVKLIDLKMNEELLEDKNKKIKIKLFTLRKNDFIGLEDSLELKSRFYYVQCVSEKGSLNKIRILDFIIFIASNHSLQLDNIINYVQKRKNTIIERISNNLSREISYNKRIITNAYSLALSSYEKRKNLHFINKNEIINNIKKININKNNFIEKIQELNQTNKKFNNLNQYKNIRSQRKRSVGLRRYLFLNHLFNNDDNDEQKNDIKKLNIKEKTYIKNKIKDQLNASIFSFKSKSIEKNKIKSLKKENSKNNISISLLKSHKKDNGKLDIEFNFAHNLFARPSYDKDKKISRNKNYDDPNNILNYENYTKNCTFSKTTNNCEKIVSKYCLTTTFCGNLISDRESSYNNTKLDKQILNMTGIYNTEREKQREKQKKQLIYISPINKKRYWNLVSNYKLNYLKKIKTRKKSNPMVTLLSISDSNNNDFLKINPDKNNKNIKNHKFLNFSYK